MREIRYFYYRLYKYYSTGKTPPFISVFCAIFGVLIFNFYTLSNLAVIIFNFRLIDVRTFKGGTIGYLWVLVLVVPLYFVFDHFIRKKGLHERIMEEFKCESKKACRISKAMSVLYILLSIGCFFLTLWLRDIIRGY